MTFGKKVLTAVFFAVMPMAPATAQGIPVFDATSVANLIQQLQALDRDFRNQIDQLTQLQDQLTAMTGSRGIGNVLNGAAEIAQREAAISLQGIMDGAIAGTSIPGNTGGIDSTIQRLRSTMELDDLDQLLASTFPQDRAIAVSAGAGMAAMATAEDTYARANASMGRVTQLIQDIDTNADLKASVDYNTRMLAEVAILLNETLRIQAAQATAAGSDAVVRARDAAAGREFRDVEP